MNIMFLFVFCIQMSSEAALSRDKAYEMLKRTGFRWRQTEIMQLEANAKSAEAKSLRMPQLQLSAKEYLGKVNPLQYGLSINADTNLIAIGTTAIELGFILFDRSISDRIEAASKNQNLTSLQKEQYQLDLTSLMLAQFLNVQRLQRKLKALDASLSRSQEIEKIAQDKVSSGLGVKLDLMRAQTLLAAEELRALDANLSLSKAKQELATTLGQERLTDELEHLEVQWVDSHKILSIYENIIEQRPDIKGSKLGVTVTQLLEDAASHDRWPKVGLFGSIGVFHTGSAFGLGANNVNGMGGVLLSLPLYSGGRISAKEQEEHSKKIKAELNEHQLLLEAKSQLHFSALQIKTAQSAIHAAERQLKTVEEELRLVKQRFKSGSGNGLDVTNTLVNVANAHDSYIDAIFSYEVSKVSLFKNIGSFEKYFHSREGAK